MPYTPPTLSKPTALPKIPPLATALSTVRSNPYDTSQLQQAFQAFKPYEAPTPDAAPVPQAPAPAPAPASPPASAPPAAGSPPAAPTYQGVAIPDYTADPIYVAALALSQQQVADAQAQAAAATRNALTSYGHIPGTDTSLYPDQNTLLAAEQNPFSTLANMAYTHGQRVHGLEENVNNANLWYSGEHAKELGTEGRQYLGEQANASAALAQALAGIQSGELNAERGAQQANLSAEEAAMQRAIDWALAHPGSTYTPGDGLQGLPPGTTIPPIVNPDGSSDHGTPGGGQTGYQGGTAAPPGVPAGTPPAQWPGHGSYGADASKQYSSVPYYTGQKPVSGAGSGETGGPAVFANPAYPTTTAASAAPGAGGGAGTSNLRFIWDVNAPSTYSALSSAQSAGNAGIVIREGDPETAQKVAAAAQAGRPVSFQVNVGAGETPESLAAKVAKYTSQYPGASITIDAEQYDVVRGAGGAAWNQAAAQAVSTAAGNTPITITTEGVSDFNYAAWAQNPNVTFAPQAYNGDMSPRDVQQVVDLLVAQGVPRDRIIPILAPGQSPGTYTGPYSVYGIPTGGQSGAAAPAPTTANPTPLSYKPTSVTSQVKQAATAVPPVTLQQVQQAAGPVPTSTSLTQLLSGAPQPLPQLTPSILQSALKQRLLQ